VATTEGKAKTHLVALQAALKVESPKAAAKKVLESLAAARAELADEKVELALLIVQGGEQAVLTIDIHGMITGATPQSEAVIGRAVDDIVGKPIDLFIKNRGQSPPASAKEMEEAGRGAEVVSVRTQQRSDGTTFEAEHTVLAVVGRSGHVSGFVRQIRDISERRVHEIRIEELDATIALLIPDDPATSPGSPDK
jgi:PAS domain S-box-containing protein